MILNFVSVLSLVLGANATIQNAIFDELVGKYNTFESLRITQDHTHDCVVSLADIFYLLPILRRIELDPKKKKKVGRNWARS